VRKCHWINLAQDRDQWQAFVNMIMNLFGSLKGREFLDKLNNYQLLKKGPALCS
jgi:hypothetical protein